ncbi:GNAT family N-acetyltransferase [Actinobaculum sp. 352]|uniref:GNAT family N-acetyltransferase n=1 Tax=Actinobaculum sp. 352 TaxID=2490946 RepID=UPI000F7ECEE2|nr:GNAT family N-acetyltransferase [Actinobaculum sp. 352]RTE50729.1 N-acetyltransferase [Actinobaculum sp. 352]
MQLTMTLPRREYVSQGAIPQEVRSLTEQDVTAVGRLYFESYPPGTVEDEMEAIADISAALNGEYGIFLPDQNLVYEHDNEIVGCIMVVDSPPWDDVAEQIFVIDLFVHPDHRGEGIGRTLLSTALERVPYDRIIGLRVESENSAAIALYTSIGFTQAN